MVVAATPDGVGPSFARAFKRRRRPLHHQLGAGCFARPPNGGGKAELCRLRYARTPTLGADEHQRS